MAAPDYKNRTLYPYTVASLLAMAFMSFMLTMAQAGTNLQNNAYTTVYTGVTTSGQAITNGQAGTYNQSAINGIQTGYNQNNVLDPTASSVDWSGGLGKVVGMTAQTATNMATIWGWPVQYIGGALGWFLTVVVLIWQLQIGYLVLKFILPTRV